MSRLTLAFKKKVIEGTSSLIRGELTIKVLEIHGSYPPYVQLEIGITDTKTHELLVELETITVGPEQTLHLQDIREAFKVKIR